MSAACDAKTVHGYVTEAGSGEALIGVSVVDTLTRRGTVTNEYGFFSLNTQQVALCLRVSYVGHEAQILCFNAARDTTLTIALQGMTLEAVTIKASEDPNNRQQNLTTVVQIPVAQLAQVPTLGGENDVLKVLATTPGVTTGVEGTSALLVRGGSADQTMVLLDEAVVYNVSHVHGFLSMFNTDAIKHVSLYKDGFPARYGGRLSSVLDISMKEGNQEQWSGKLDIGALVNSVLVEGPLKKNQSSILFTARAGNFGLLRFPQRIAFAQQKRSDYYSFGFYDLNAKVNYRFNDQHRVYLSYYHGYDQKIGKEQSQPVTFRQECLQWGNTTLSARYNGIINPQLFAKATLAYVQYDYSLNKSGYLNTYQPDTSNFNYDQQQKAAINDISAKIAINYLPHPNHNARLGIDFTQHHYLPTAQIGNFSTRNSEQQHDTTFVNRQQVYAQELAIYAEDEWEINRHFRVQVGLHYSGFAVQQRYYQALEPRCNVYYALGDWAALKLSYSYMQQYIHLLTNYGIGFPVDIWVPATARIAPQNAHQIAISLDKSITQQQIDISLAAYYKKMAHVIEYRDGSSYLFNYTANWEDLVATNGKGEGYGLEAMIHKKTGVFSGWCSYALAYQQRQFPSLNKGTAFPYTYDQRHTINIVLNTRLGKHWSIATNFTYRTGRPFTIPIGVYGAENLGNYYIYDTRNNYRMPAYHRADVNINYQWYARKKIGTHTLSIGAYNVYDKVNVNRVELVRQTATTFQLYYRSLFPFFPFIAYSRNFSQL